MEVAVPVVAVGNASSSSSPQSRTDAIEQLHAVTSAACSLMLDVVASFDIDEQWALDGCSSMTSWLEARLGISRASASEHARVALALRSLPHLRSAFSSGSLSWEQLVLITKLADASSDASWAAEGPSVSIYRLRALVRLQRSANHAESLARRDRSLKWSWIEDHSTLRLRGSLDASSGATFVAAMGRIIENDGALDLDPGEVPSIEQRQADALVELASTRLSEDGDADRATVVVHADIGTFLEAASGLDGPPVDRPPEPSAEVSIDDVATGTDVRDQARQPFPRRAEIDGAVSIAQRVLETMSCDARMQLVVNSNAGVSVGIGRVSRTIPAWMNRLLRRRDRGCRFPGCGRRRWTHGHHIQYWSRGGRTDLENLVLLCVRHHHLVHDDGWAIAGSPSGTLSFTKGSTTLTGAPKPLRDEVRARFGFLCDDERQSDAGKGSLRSDGPSGERAGSEQVPQGQLPLPGRASGGMDRPSGSKSGANDIARSMDDPP